MSNKWNFKIDLDKVKEEEMEELERVIIYIFNIYFEYLKKLDIQNCKIKR